MTHRLNLSRIARVHRAALQSGWFQLTLSEFVQVPMEDTGSAMYLTYPDGSRYAVADFDGEDVVTLRKIA